MSTQQRNSLKLESVGAQTVGAGKDRWQAPFNGEVINAQAVVGTAPTGAALIVDVLKNGASIFPAGGLPTIAAGSTATVDPVAPVAGTTFAPKDVLSLSVTQVGTTVAGSDLDVTIQFVNK